MRARRRRGTKRIVIGTIVARCSVVARVRVIVIPMRGNVFAEGGKVRATLRNRVLTGPKRTRITIIIIVMCYTKRSQQRLLPTHNMTIVYYYYNIIT